MTEVGDKRRARINREKDLFQNRIGYGDAIVRHVFRMRIVQREIERCERELAAISNPCIRQLGVVYLFPDFAGNLLRRVTVIRRERVEHLLVPHPVLEHLRRRLYEITGHMRASETSVLGTSNNGMQTVAEFVK